MGPASFLRTQLSPLPSLVQPPIRCHFWLVVAQGLLHSHWAGFFILATCAALLCHCLLSGVDNDFQVFGLILVSVSQRPPCIGLLLAIPSRFLSSQLRQIPLGLKQRTPCYASLLMSVFPMWTPFSSQCGPSSPQAESDITWDFAALHLIVLGMQTSSFSWLLCSGWQSAEESDDWEHRLWPEPNCLGSNPDPFSS